jgi:hypothetical protein
MSNAPAMWGRVRLALELLLGACTLWLIAQNVALLSLMPWKDAPPVLVLAGAVLHALWLVAREAWPVLMAAVVVAVALIAILTARTESWNAREARHV